MKSIELYFPCSSYFLDGIGRYSKKSRRRTRIVSDCKVGFCLHSHVFIWSSEFRFAEFERSKYDFLCSPDFYYTRLKIHAWSNLSLRQTLLNYLSVELISHHFKKKTKKFKPLRFERAGGWYLHKMILINWCLSMVILPTIHTWPCRPDSLFHIVSVSYWREFITTHISLRCYMNSMACIC